MCSGRLSSLNLIWRADCRLAADKREESVRCQFISTNEQMERDLFLVNSKKGSAVKYNQLLSSFFSNSLKHWAAGGMVFSFTLEPWFRVLDPLRPRRSGGIWAPASCPIPGWALGGNSWLDQAAIWSVLQSLFAQFLQPGCEAGGYYLFRRNEVWLWKCFGTDAVVFSFSSFF